MVFAEVIVMVFAEVFDEVPLLINFQSLINVQHVTAFKLRLFMVTPILPMEKMIILINSELWQYLVW